MKYYIQLDNNWFKLYNETNLINIIGINSFYLLINLLLNRGINNQIYFNKQLLCNIFWGKRSESYKLVYNELYNLVSYNILKLLVDIDFNNPNRDDFIRAEVNFPLTFKDNYFMLYYDEILKIVNYNGKENKPKLLALFCAIKRRIYSNQATYIELKILEKETKINRKTINKYIKILKDLGLIIYKNAGLRINEYGTYKESPNHFVISFDGAEDILDAEIEQYRIKEINRGITFV